MGNQCSNILSYFDVFHFQFMIHDEWSNSLFLHWKLPLSSSSSSSSSDGDKIIIHHDCPSPFPRSKNDDLLLESILDRHVFPFQVERHMGHYWVGLVLLTEKNVGPAFSWCRSTSYTCVSHHGVNVRTYVTGNLNETISTHNQKQKLQDGNDDNNINNEQNLLRSMPSTVVKQEERGIHFASLECNNLFTSIGANMFGMPYRYASIQRKEFVVTNKTQSNNQEHEAMTSFQMTSSRREPWLMNIWKVFNKLAKLLRKALVATSRFGFINAGSNNVADIKETSESEENGSFSVHCSWECQGSTKETNIAGNMLEMNDVAKVPETSFFVERYLVYTRKYFLNWVGRVHHEPWPVENAVVRSLKITNVDRYTPVHMQPILQYMADHAPDLVQFSPGVGPISFDMLRPAML
jgi:hypothetical protein